MVQFFDLVYDVVKTKDILPGVAPFIKAPWKRKLHNAIKVAESEGNHPVVASPSSIQTFLVNRPDQRRMPALA